MPLLPILADSNSSLWSVSVNTSGILLTQKVGSGTVLTPIMPDQQGNAWALTVSTLGELKTAPSAATVTDTQFILLDANGIYWVMTVDISGALLTVAGIPAPTCPPPSQPNITESQFPFSGIYHQPTGNPVTVMADYSLYCCALGEFVPPESTNIITILDE